MKLRETIARMLAPGMSTENETTVLVEELSTMAAQRAEKRIDKAVKEAVSEARQAMPMHLDYDPNGDGYRRLTGQNRQQERDLSALSQDTMIELAYYLYDTSGLVKRFVRDTRNFTLGEGITYEVENDEDGKAKDILDDFWHDPINQMDLRLTKRIEFLGLLGEQCWPVQVDPHNGKVWLTYVDPVNIEEVLLVKDFPEMAAAVKLKGSTGRSGPTLPVIRTETSAFSKNKGKLVGECFFFSINNPPNASRGRSDMIHLFDFIDGFEAGLFDEIDRLKLIKAFVWDVTLTGADDTKIKDFIQNTAPPKAGSMRVHNEQVEYNAVAPDLKVHDNKALFETCKTYLSACMNRPDSWLGSGGKAYQNEADLMGEPTFKDLAERQNYLKYSLQFVLRFVLDQAIVHGSLRDDPANPFKVKVNMPEMSSMNLKDTVDGMFTLSQSLTLATDKRWISHDDAAGIFASVASQTGVEVSPLKEVDPDENGDKVTEDYKKAIKTPESDFKGK